MINKLIAMLGAAVLAAAAGAQTYYHGDHNILVPKSNAASGRKFHTNYLINVSRNAPHGNGSNLTFSHGPMAAQGGGPSGYHPADLQAAYNQKASGGTAAIAIVDAFDLPTALQDFNTFSSTFGLPQESSTNPTASTNKVFQVVYAQGVEPAPDQGWQGEEALDIEWAHSLAPHAKIYLVEAQDNGGSLYDAVTVAEALPGVHEVSMSWLSGEFQGEQAEDPGFNYPNVVCFAASGDSGGVDGYPCHSPNVVGVGGTSLFMSGNSVTSEVVWGGSGGGPSTVESRPSYQDGIQSIVGNWRGSPDIAAVADPYTGVAVYSTDAFGGWAVIGGTSLACPVCAGIANNRGEFSASTAAELSRVYDFYAGQNYSKLYRDITSGSSGPYQAAAGFDFCTGIGCPVGALPPVTSGPYLATAISVYNGTWLQGDASDLAQADGISYDIFATHVTNVGEASAGLATFQIDRGPASFQSLGVQFNAGIPLGTTFQVFAYNVSSKRYDVVAAFPGRGVAATANLATINHPANYMDANNQVKLVVRAFFPEREGGAAFTLKLDQLYIVGNLSL